MASEGPKSIAFTLLILNLILYFIVSAISGWAINFGIDNEPETVYGFSLPVRLFPMHFPIGNMATGFFVVFSLLAGVVGIASSAAGINNILKWNVNNLLSAATSSLIASSLTLLAMGLACKEINIGGRGRSLRTLEALTIILGCTQLICTGAIHAGVSNVTKRALITGAP